MKLSAAKNEQRRHIFVQFKRETKPDSKRKHHKKDALFHEGYIFPKSSKDNETKLMMDPDYDLAIIKMTDDDGFYQGIFADNPGSEKLFCSDNDYVKDDKSMDYYLYGYPVTGEGWTNVGNANKERGR